MFEFIQEFIQFDDSIHAIFQDQSALIYQNNGQISYFNSKGERSRIKVDNCRKFDNINAKVQEVLKIASQYTYLIPESINYEEVVKSKKIETIMWPLNPKLENNNLIIQSIDGFASIMLDLQTFVLTLTYYSSGTPVTIVKNQENGGDFVNNFIKKYNLGQTKQQQNIECGIGYSYRIVKKNFSLINFPVQWIAPFFILVKDQLHNEKCLNFNQFLVQNLDIQFPVELIDYLMQEEEYESNQDYFLKTYNFYRIQDQLVTKILIDQPLKTNPVNDNVSPVMNKISQMNLGRPIFMFTPQIQFWFQVDAGIGLLNGQLLIRDGIFWQLEKQKWEQSIYNDKYQLGQFDVYCKHLNNRYKNQENVLVKQLQNQFQPIEYYRVEQGNFDELRKVEIREVGEFLVLKNGTVKAKFVDRTVITFKYPPPCNIRIITQYGFINNIDFHPIIDERLLQTYNHYLEYFEIEFQQYMQYCLKVAEECFIQPQIFSQREQHQTQLNSWIESEMEKNQRFLVLSGKYIFEEQNLQQQEEVQSLDDKIQMLLIANQEMLTKLRK